MSDDDVWIVPFAPGQTKDWPKRPDDPHDHDWSGWAGIYRSGHQICLICGISTIETELVDRSISKAALRPQGE